MSYDDINIKIDDLSMSFGDNKVLKNICFEANKGEIIGYIGPNGAGKSTTIKIILGLLSGYKGEVNVLGQNIANTSVKYKEKIGYVPESGDLYESLTAKEFLTFIGELYGIHYDLVDKRAKELINIFGMSKAYNGRISSFSKGMKQKVLIIASILHDPDILFLDEPLNGLDANTVMVVKELLVQLALNGKTIFYSSHIMDVVEKISSRIILIDKGIILADGTIEELRNKVEQGSLENIFNKLTGFNEHENIASDIISVIKEGV